MAKSKPITISDFSAGLQTLADPAELPLGAAQVCQDVMLDRGDLRVRDGRVVNTACPVHLTTSIRAIGELYMAGHSPEHRFIAVNATKIYWNVNNTTARLWTADTAIAQGQFRRATANVPTGATTYVYEATAVAGDAKTHATTEPTWPVVAGNTVVDDQVTWTCRSVADNDYWDEINTAYTVHATNHISMKQSAASLYIADGSNWIRELNADGVFTTLTDFPGPTTAPVLDVVTGNLTLDSSDQWTAARDGYTNQGGYNSGGSWVERPGKDVYTWHATNAGGINSPHVDIGSMYALAQNTTVYTGDSADRSYSMSLYVDAAGDYDGRLDGGNVYLVRKRYPTVRTDTHGNYNGFPDLTDATYVNFSMYVEADEMVCADGVMTMWLVLGEGDTAANWQKVAITADAAGNAIATLAVETWHDFSVDISAVAASAINAVEWVGIYFGSFNMTPETTPAGTTDDYIRISFSPFVANVSTASFQPDDYEFTYTFWDDGLDEESSEYIDPANLAAAYPSLSLNYNIPSGIQITVTRPIGSAAESAYVYARGGVQAGDFRRIGTITFTGDTTAVRTGQLSQPWDGTYGQNEPYLAQYIGRPPKGCTMMDTYRNRMIYAGRLPRLTWKASTSIDYGTDVVPITLNGYYYVCTVAGTTGATEPTWGTTPGGTTVDNTATWTCYVQDAADVLFYSNYGDPTRVKVVPFSLAQNPVNEGGWVDTERYGNNITGLLGAGRLLYAWKSQSIFRASGDPGITGDAPDAFFLERLDTREGCLSPTSPCWLDGVVCWQGKDKILSLATGESKPVSLTDAITPTVQAYSSTKQGTAFSLYDSANKRFYMFYPSGSYGTSPNSEALVLSLKGEGSGWTQFTAQPGACGIYSAYASTPGVYIADAYGASGRGKLFRLSSTAVTDALSYGAAAAISWAWVSGAIIPFNGYYCQVEAVRANLVTADTASAYTLACTLWLNNDDGRTKTRNLTVTRKIGFGDESQGTGLVDWTLAPHGEVEGVALKLARNDANIVAVRNVTLVLRPVAPVRGRTVSRG